MTSSTNYFSSNNLITAIIDAHDCILCIQCDDVLIMFTSQGDVGALIISMGVSGLGTRLPN